MLLKTLLVRNVSSATLASFSFKVFKESSRLSNAIRAVKDFTGLDSKDKTA